MKRRRGSKHDYLIRSDRSGFVFPASEMVTQWDGLLVHKSEVEERNPQEFVRARRDPEALTDVRPRASQEGTYCPLKYTQVGAAIGTAKIGTAKIGTTLVDNWPPGSIGNSQFGSLAIGTMSVGCTLQVYPD